MGETELPDRIGPYRVVRRLGAGGMGVVYLAEDERLQREVALKVLGVRLAAEAEHRQRFLREARAAARINHPNVIQVHASGEDGEVAWLAMEYLEGGSLGDLLRERGSLTVEESLPWLENVVAGLHAAWKKNVIHRDVKPDNILLSGDGYAKIADFGLSKVYGEDQRLTKDGAILGSPPYMSPEQVEGKSLDLHSDMYSLGATFFHLLSGQQPYKADSPIATAFKHLREPVPSLASVAPHVPKLVCAVVERLLQKKPDQRFDGYEELAEALRRLAIQRDAVRPPTTASSTGDSPTPKGEPTASGGAPTPLPRSAPVASTARTASTAAVVASASSFPSSAGSGRVRVVVVEAPEQMPSPAEKRILFAGAGAAALALLGVMGLVTLAAAVWMGQKAMAPFRRGGTTPSTDAPSSPAPRPDAGPAKEPRSPAGPPGSTVSPPERASYAEEQIRSITKLAEVGDFYNADQSLSAFRYWCSHDQACEPDFGPSVMTLVGTVEIARGRQLEAAQAFAAAYKTLVKPDAKVIVAQKGNAVRISLSAHLVHVFDQKPLTWDQAAWMIVPTMKDSSEQLAFAKAVDALPPKERPDYLPLAAYSLVLRRSPEPTIYLQAVHRMEELLVALQAFEDLRSLLDDASRHLEGLGVIWSSVNDELFLLGVAQSRTGHKEDARQTLEKALQISRDPNDPVRAPTAKGLVEVPVGDAVKAALAELS